MVVWKTREGVQGALDCTPIRKFFEEQAMMYWTWESLLISVCMLMNVVLCMHCKATLCLCLFRHLYVEPLSFRRYCVICIALIPKIAAVVARFLLICPRCTCRRICSQAPNCGFFFVCLIAWLWALSCFADFCVPQRRQCRSTHPLIHTRSRMTTQMHKQDFPPWLAHAHKTHSLTHSGIIMLVKLEKNERDNRLGRAHWTKISRGREKGERSLKYFVPPSIFFKHLSCPWPTLEDKPLLSAIAALWLM